PAAALIASISFHPFITPTFTGIIYHLILSCRHNEKEIRLYQIPTLTFMLSFYHNTVECLFHLKMLISSASPIGGISNP
ncbi:hypothetical protein LI129_21910, partial [Erysipelatoclostridium ramosum]|uniref:hypothetical protein n=1 Tax=Thomasclavelia ramosa TaxID=1547 RepID=UPI001D06DF4A